MKTIALLSLLVLVEGIGFDHDANGEFNKRKEEAKTANANRLTT